ncbi:hypothetical protein ACSBR2_030695 [Camellia fascicularis]
MNSKHPPVRVLGQRSIASTFLFRTSKPNPSTDCKGDVKIKTLKRDSRVSLSDFLNRKLHRSSVLPSSAQGKDRPFCPPVGKKDVSGSNEGQNGVKEVKPVHELVFEQLKWTRKENEDCLGSCADGEGGSSCTENMQESRKRKIPSAGEDGKQSAQKHLVVLGDCPRPIHPIPKKKGEERSFTASKKPRRLFNHYANGSGWWDYNMEGVDNEEVGCNEVWEGIGSATLGGLDWQ